MCLKMVKKCPKQSLGKGSVSQNAIANVENGNNPIFSALRAPFVTNALPTTFFKNLKKIFPQKLNKNFLLAVDN